MYMCCWWKAGSSPGGQDKHFMGPCPGDWGGRGLLGEAAPGFPRPTSLHPASKAQAEAGAQSFCFILKPGPLESVRPAVPVAARRAPLGASGQRAPEPTGGAFPGG